MGGEGTRRRQKLKFKTSLNCRLSDSHGYGIRNEDVEFYCLRHFVRFSLVFWSRKKHKIVKYHRSEFRSIMTSFLKNVCVNDEAMMNLKNASIPSSESLLCGKNLHPFRWFQLIFIFNQFIAIGFREIRIWDFFVFKQLVLHFVG